MEIMGFVGREKSLRKPCHTSYAGSIRSISTPTSRIRANAKRASPFEWDKLNLRSSAPDLEARAGFPNRPEEKRNRAGCRWRYPARIFLSTPRPAMK